jgi:hypothetical protein
MRYENRGGKKKKRMGSQYQIKSPFRTHIVQLQKGLWEESNASLEVVVWS